MDLIGGLKSVINSFFKDVKNNIDDLTEKIIFYLKSAIKFRYQKRINACMN